MAQLEAQRRGALAAPRRLLPICRPERNRPFPLESPEGLPPSCCCSLHILRQFQIVYNHQVFDSTEDFLSAFKNGTLIRIPNRPDDEKADYSWTTRKRVGAQRDLDNLPGPRSVSFAGLRFRVDKARQFVSWMGWSMYLGFDRDMGMNLWNIAFKGERIIYQVCTLSFLCTLC